MKIPCNKMFIMFKFYRMQWSLLLRTHITQQFSVSQIEYPLGGSSKKGSHVYFLLIAAMVLLWCQIVLLWHQVTMVASEQHLFQTIVQFDKTIVLPRKHATGSIHKYLFCYCPLLGILFEVLRIWSNTCFISSSTIWLTMWHSKGFLMMMCRSLSMSFHILMKTHIQLASATCISSYYTCPDQMSFLYCHLVNGEIACWNKSLALTWHLIS